MPAIADLYLPESGIREVVLDIGRQRRLSPAHKDIVFRVGEKLQRNERLPSYRSRRVQGDRLVLECDEIDYATNLAMLKGEIPREGLMPVGTLGVPEIKEGIAVGVLGDAYSSGKVQGIPAGMINLDGLNPETTPVLDGFYSELFEETGLARGHVQDVRCLGMVYDRQHNQLAVAYSYGTGTDFKGFSIIQRSAPRHREYSRITFLPKDPAVFALFAQVEGDVLPPLPHCKGAVILYGLKEFPDSEILLKLIGKEGKIFGYF